MSGTEDFGTGGYGAGDAERAAAEPGPGGSTRNAPPTGPRVHVPNPNPVPGPHQGAAAAGAPNGTPNGTPWLAAGSVPYAEAMFGAGQDGQQQHQQPQGPTNALRAAAERAAAARVPRGAGAGRRGVPEAAGQVQTAGPGGYPDPYAPDYGSDGYANGYAQQPGQPQQPPAQPQMPQLPQQRYDAAPFDSGFTQQARFAQQAQAQAQGQSPQGGYEQPQPQQPSADRSSSGFEPAAGYEQAPYQGQPYPGAAQPPGQRRGPGFDEPTTEFMPGPLFDEPTVRPASPPPGQASAGAGLNGRGSVFSSRQSAQDPQAPASTPGSQPPVNGGTPGQPAGATLRPSMSGSGTWSAAPPPAAAQQQPQQPQMASQESAASQPPASVSGIPRVPSQQAASQSSQSLQTQPPAQAAAAAPGSPLASAGSAPVGGARGEAPPRADGGYANAPMPSRPPLPDEPPPGPPPLPVRPPRAERQAQQAQVAGQSMNPAQAQQSQAAQSAAAQSAAAAQALAQSAAAAHVVAQSAAAQAAAAQSPVAQSPAAQSAVRSAAAGAVRETLTPPRRAPQPPSAEQPAAPAAQQQQAADDLTSERMRSVAPNVATPRAAAPEPQPQQAAAPAAPTAAPATAPVAPHEADADEGDELIVPWQATGAPPAAEALDDEDDDDVLHGSGSHQHVQQDQAPAAPAQQPQAPSQPQPQPQPQTPVQAQQAAAAPVGSAPAAAQAPQTGAPTRAEATATAASPATSAPAAPPAAAQPPAASPASAPTASAPSANVPDPAAPAAVDPNEAEPAAAESNAPTVPAPRGTRRRVREPDGEADPRTYAPTAAPAPDGSAPQQPQAQPQPQAEDTDPDVDPDHLPTARQPRLHLESVPPSSAPPTASAPDGPRVPAYDDEALAAVYRVIHERRDVRNDFLPDPVPTDVLTRILRAAHTAPSVGFSQPWDFLVIRDQAMRQRVHELAVRQRRSYAASLPKARARAFAALKIEAILETPINIIVTCDPTRGGRHTLGRYTQPLMAPFSSCLAVENLWLAARAEGLGVGWVSFFDEGELAAVLDLPDHLQVVAYLCVGYVKSFPPEPELAGAGWAQRRPLAWAVHEEHYGHRALPGSEPVSLLSETVAAIRGLDPEALGAARDRQARMTKPPGSLGALEALSEQLSGLAGVCPPPMPEPAALAVFAADHGVHAQGVTPWPQEVTAQMVANFLAGGAVVNAFAKQVGAEVCVVDVGVAADLPTRTGLIPRKVRYGTADMTQGPALTREEATAAIEAGIETARDLVAAGNKCLLTGDMGIANTTASAALIAAFTGASPAQVTGYGTGIDEQTYAHKVEVVRAALQLHRPDPADPVGVLCAFGGLEHAALAGFILGCAALRIPVVLDGVIAGAAALVAQALSPEVTAACVAGHRSAEPGHALALEQLGITPLIDLELRLGEGSGAALALPLVGAAVRALREVATFDDAGVSDASAESVVPPSSAERERA